MHYEHVYCIRKLLVPVATVLLCIATAHLIVDFVRVLEAFVDVIGVSAYCSNLATPLEFAKTALYTTQTTLADSVLVWRCYVLNGRSLLVAIPGLIVLLINAAVGYYIVWALSEADMPLTIVFTTVHSSVTIFFTLTMLTSVTCTTLIAWRIYRTRRLMSDGFAAFLPVLIVIVESGALYTTSILATLLAYLTGSGFPILDAVTPIVVSQMAWIQAICRTFI
ncbi:hypothetical protein EDB19DRAFT_1731152 [Suillus lakei]|nr:hypothetical protein EDB19DRAFT_1731152 [Suillus lakei]